ncbi:CPBP family intramembrane glutamic endopeptidase [Clostridium lacusfryxellense]|uniref:CPBP family intramembrane glutamic endopeptidase n=1 Tax=Clostridium lacusfryxellense TaxID=205328 RepID=UPI001C0C009A|nr:CPBP family intramembrane glutamic endopeptidase [Clostridium lacusfryxellense]MBU3110228.1 CPBP family intramembrane metalloprotease [Clostridium lacusfryxellense]
MNRSNISFCTTKLQAILVFMCIVFLPILLLLISGVTLSRIFVHIMNYPVKIFITWFSMGLSFVFLPYLFIKKNNKVSLADFGILKITKKEFIFCLTVIISLYSFLILRTNSVYIIIIATLQNLGVAFSEEFFNKGVMFFQSKKIFSNSVFVVVLCSLVFAFILHSADPPLVNLFYRFPLGLITGYAYLKTNKLYIPVTIHFINNMLSTGLLN